MCWICPCQTQRSKLHHINSPLGNALGWTEPRNECTIGDIKALLKVSSVGISWGVCSSVLLVSIGQDGCPLTNVQSNRGKMPLQKAPFILDLMFSISQWVLGQFSILVSIKRHLWHDKCQYRTYSHRMTIVL